CVTFQTAAESYERVWLALRGRHQIENSALAIELAELLQSARFQIPPSAVVKGLQSAEHPGRLELISQMPAILLDGAHNPAGAKSLRDYLDEFGSRPLTLVFGAMRDKQLEQIAKILFPVDDLLVLTPIRNP